MLIAESDSPVRSTLQGLNQQSDAHRRVRLSGGMHTMSCLKNFDHLTMRCDANREVNSAVWSALRSLIPGYDAPLGVWLHRVMHTTESDFEVGCTLWSFKKIWISRRNQNWIRKYFSLFIRGLDGFESWKKWRAKILWHTPFDNVKLNWPLSISLSAGASHLQICNLFQTQDNWLFYLRILIHFLKIYNSTILNADNPEFSWSSPGEFFCLAPQYYALMN